MNKNDWLEEFIKQMANKPQRDPSRLDDFYEAFKEIHKKAFPDWRFGQLCSNFFGWLMTEKGRDLFFPEEKEMIEAFREYANETSPYNRGI